MLLYLIQHAEARREAEDPERGLTETGLTDARKVSAYAARHGVVVSQILHSNKKRAAQTAEAIKEHLRPARGASVAEGLSPLDDPQIIAGALKALREDTALVGHLPHLSKLASLLLCGDQSMDIISFRMACIVCLERHEEEAGPGGPDFGRWSVRWMVVPEMAG